MAFKEIAEEMPKDSLLKRPLAEVNNLIVASAPAGFIVPEEIRDPFLVLKSALTNAVSVAGTFSTIAGIVTAENPHVCRCAGAVEEEENN